MRLVNTIYQNTLRKVTFAELQMKKEVNIKSISWPERIFVTGIDTDAGKSYATGWLARLMMDNDLSVITQKFVQTGNIDFSEDIEVHRRLMGIPMQPVDLLHLTAPLIYTYPASPDLAAKIDGTEVNTARITEATKLLCSQYQHVIIEGAGGLMVPLKGEYLTIDYVREQGLPIVLVTNSKLGSINHTLLALRTISDYKLRLLAVVYNPYFDYNSVKIAKDTREYIRNWVCHHYPDTLFLEMDKY